MHDSIMLGSIVINLDEARTPPGSLGPSGMLDLGSSKGDDLTAFPYWTQNG